MSDATFVGNVLNSLPLDKMIAAPLNAMIGAQIAASRQYAKFLLDVCMKNGKANNVVFKYDELITDKNGNYQGKRERVLSIPLIAAVSHPNIGIEEGTISFELAVHNVSEDHSSTEGSLTAEASVGWGPFKVNVHGTVTHKSEQTRKSDTTAKYTVMTRIKKMPPPEGMQKVIDFMINDSIKPVVISRISNEAITEHKGISFNDGTECDPSHVTQ